MRGNGRVRNNKRVRWRLHKGMFPDGQISVRGVARSRRVARGEFLVRVSSRARDVTRGACLPHEATVSRGSEQSKIHER